MLDIRVIRENPEEVKARLKPRSGDAWKLVDDVLACDEARRNAETEKQALQSERNATSKQIGMLKKKGEDTSSIEARVREIGDPHPGTGPCRGGKCSPAHLPADEHSQSAAPGMSRGRG